MYCILSSGNKNQFSNLAVNLSDQLIFYNYYKDFGPMVSLEMMMMMTRSKNRY